MTETTRRHLRGATLIWMVSVAASRVAGLLREMVIARTAGATGQTDVYFTAFTIPDFLNYLLAGGALSVTFIPILLGFIVAEREEEGWSVFSRVFWMMLGALVLLIVPAMIFAPEICRLQQRGFTPEQLALLVRYTRILLPAQLCFFIGGLFGAAQMARGRHAIYALSPLVYNAGTILGGLLLGPRLGMEGFCWGTLAGAVIGHGVIQAIGARAAGMRLSTPAPLRHPAIKSWFLMTIPFMIGQSILATDDWIVRYFGSGLGEASISWLNYAKKLALVLPAVLGQASAVASFPLLARQIAAGETGTMVATLRTSLVRSLLLAGLGAILLGVLNREAVLLAFGAGRFSTSDALSTGRALSILVIAVPALVAQAIVARGYYALRDTWTPTIIGTVMTLAGIPLYGWLSRWFNDPSTLRGGGYLGLAWASAISLTLYGTVLAGALARRIRRLDPTTEPFLPAGLLFRSAILLLLTLILTALLRGGIGRWNPDEAILPAIGRTILVGAGGVVIFLALATLLRLTSFIGVDPRRLIPWRRP